MKTCFQSNDSPIQTVKNLIKRNSFHKLFGLICKAKLDRLPENIDAVAQTVREQPSTSTLHRSQKLNIPRTFQRIILHKDLGLKAYKVHLVQQIKAHNHSMHFAQWVKDHLADDDYFYQKIVFSN